MKTKKYQIVYWHVDNVYEHSCESGRWTLVFGNMWCSLDFMVYIVSDITHSTRTEILTHSTRMSHIRNSFPPTFHPGVSHLEFCRLTFYLIRMSHIQNSSPPTFHPGISHSEFFYADIPPGYLTYKSYLIINNLKS